MATVPVYCTSTVRYEYDRFYRLRNWGKPLLNLSGKNCPLLPSPTSTSTVYTLLLQYEYSTNIIKLWTLIKRLDTYSHYLDTYTGIIPCPTYFLFWKCVYIHQILRDVDLFEFVLHLYDHLCFIYGKIIFQCSFRNGKSTTVLPYKNRIKRKSLVQMKFDGYIRTFKKGNTWGMGLGHLLGHL